MLRIFADHHYLALALDDLAFFANLFNGWLYLHFITIPFLFGAPGDASLGQVIRRHLDRHLITGQNPYIIHSELARNMGNYDMSVRQLYTEFCIRK